MFYDISQAQMSGGSRHRVMPHKELAALRLFSLVLFVVFLCSVFSYVLAG